MSKYLFKYNTAPFSGAEIITYYSVGEFDSSNIENSFKVGTSAIQEVIINYSDGVTFLSESIFVDLTNTTTFWSDINGWLLLNNFYDISYDGGLDKWLINDNTNNTYIQIIQVMATIYDNFEAGTTLTGTEVVPMGQGSKLSKTTAQAIANLSVGWGVTGTVATLTGNSTLAMGNHDFIFSNGNVKIPITSSSQAFSLTNLTTGGYGLSARFTASDESIVGIGDFNGDKNNTSIYLNDQTATQQIAYIALKGHQFAGNVGLGTVPDATANVTIGDLAGTGTRTVLASSLGVLTAPVSDQSVKENIKPLDYGLTDLMKLRPVSFEFIDEWKSYGDGKQVGFIAQNVAEVIPEATFVTPSTGKMGYNDKELISLLVKSVQDLKTELDELKQSIT